MDFEWDEDKASKNIIKHDVSFYEAVTIWLDENARELLDRYMDGEERWVRLGYSRSARLLIVVFVEKLEPERVRIISARKATRLESEQYFKGEL